jgi:type 1 fimbria pilin
MTCRAIASLCRRVTKIGAALQLLTVLALFAVVRPAMAAQSPACVPSSSTASITLPAASLSPNQANGLIGSPGTVSVTFDCSAPFLTDQNYADNFSLLTGNLAPFDTSTVPPGGSGGILFTTNLPGIEVQLTAAQVQASSGNNGPNGGPGWKMGAISCISFTQNTNNWYCTPANTVAVTFTAQLVKTGAVIPGTGTVNSINLLQFFDQDTYILDGQCSRRSCVTSNPQIASPTTIGTLALNPVSVSVTSCSVAIDPTVVTLPTISTSSLAGVGSTTGKQPFHVQLSCPAGANLSITLATSRPQAGATGVIAPTAGSGYAQNVGVQLLKSDGATPVPFGTAISEGTTTSGTVNLPFYAQYYQTGASATAGNVAATATYTLTYQ